jgi:phosphatidylglycerophosphate synthase
MVESLKELNPICQKPDYKVKGNWYVRTLVRDAALPMTRLLLHTKVTADQVTLISLAVAMAGMAVLTWFGDGWFFFGVFLLQLWYYLDHVDGQIARYRKTVSLTGRFLDFMTHHIVHTVFLFALGFYAYRVSDAVLWIVLGFFVSMMLLVFNLIHDVKYKTFFEWIEAQGGATIRGGAEGKIESPVTDFRRKLFSFLHKLCEIHVMMNLLTVCAFLQPLVSGVDLRSVFFLFYAAVVPVVACVKMAYILKGRVIDSDYRAIALERRP